MYAIGLFDFCCTEPVLLICSFCLLKFIIELLFLTIISMLEARRCFRVTVAPANVGMAAKVRNSPCHQGQHMPLPPYIAVVCGSISIIPDLVRGCDAAQKVKTNSPTPDQNFQRGTIFFRVIDWKFWSRTKIFSEQVENFGPPDQNRP